MFVIQRQQLHLFTVYLFTGQSGSLLRDVDVNLPYEVHCGSCVLMSMCEGFGKHGRGRKEGTSHLVQFQKHVFLVRPDWPRVR